MEDEEPRLLISADDYGYAGGYDAGILAAATAGAIDAASVMVLRAPAPEPLLDAGIEVGLHLEPPAEASFAAQLELFRRLFGQPPDFLDGHKHCHAEPGRRALQAIELSRRHGIRVRSVRPRHRRLLRCKGVPTPDRLIGRMSEGEPALPAEIEAWLAGEPPAGLTEWMVHPGYRDPRSGSSYDRAREDDLELLLRLVDEPELRAARRPPF